ncbi:uncharacterized protein PFL1_00080 [Pseudozyma flocculosa PF-1]|uniref:Mitochondrial glycine transporter n=1 Tax=Pseudozyma flocculosa TaxID=84751 RepID=A0A5C3EVU1_9BASI|nr:uncharacterized protein PFL1_00080 [Pseudozyma flocculosa PF-1]EPQ31881.1 hypothetical protein PFL1_00080 [Pseudozyma flocculosa PF-1]SPO35211.1 related to Graves disease carrier protein [Pseudozyma flocculosa]
MSVANPSTPAKSLAAAGGESKGKGGVSPIATLAFGALSGGASCILLQPFDLLKTRLQQLDASESRKPRSASLAHLSRTQKLKNVTVNIVETQGWRGLWRGTVPTVVRNVPGVALYFYSVSSLRAFASTHQVPFVSVTGSNLESGSGSTSTMAKLSTVGNLATGAVARVAVGFILSPVTVVKARFESSNFSHTAESSLRSSLREIYSHGGFRGFFQGFTATALRDAPYAGLYLALYEGCKVELAALTRSADGSAGSGTGSWGVVTASGLVAGTLATVLTHPFDIIKTRMQTTPPELLAEISGKPLGPGRPPRPSLVAMTRHLLATSGPRALLDGLGLRCARKAASSAIGWGIFEGGRTWYRERENSRLLSQQATAKSTEGVQVQG